MPNDPFLHSLRQNGLRITPVLRSLLELLAQSPHPLSVPELMERLEGSGKLKPNKSTLYRQLEKLVELEVLENVSTDSQIQRFEMKKEHHHHFVCQSCEQVTDIETGPLEKAMQRFQEELRKTGHVPSAHELTFFGLCGACS